MFYIDYELVRHITAARRAQAMARFLQRGVNTPAAAGEEETAEVIELAFGAQCDPDRIGA